MSVVFVNYGVFNSNSGGHTAHFANAMARAGEDVWILGEGDPEGLSEYGNVAFRCCSFEELGRGAPAALLKSLRQPGSIIHGWTPRETVCDAIAQLTAETDAKYVIHLEDNEEVVSRSQLKADWDRFTSSANDPSDRPFPRHLSHPVRSRRLLEGAVGVTVITDALRAKVPADLPVHLLEPGVEASLFIPDMKEAERKARRRALYIPDNAKVLAYHGNMHFANQRDMFSLYTAVMILKRRGVPVVLVRSGVDYGADFDASMEFLRRDVINLGYLPRSEMIDALKLADVYVQPGAADDFNIYRLPSKVPEFLSLGRPVALPYANLGLRLRDGDEAIILSRGDGLDIADRLQALFADPASMIRIGKNGRTFALRELDWDHNARKLRDFYQQVLSPNTVKSPAPKRRKTG